MKTTTTITTIEIIIIAINNKILGTSKLDSIENEISKLNNEWNNYDRKLK